MVLSTKSVPFDVLEGYVKEFRELLSLLDIARFQVYHLQFCDNFQVAKFLCLGCFSK